MADFNIALPRTLIFEGGYANDPNDAGGETYCGISRKAWPDWVGWERVDLAKAAGVKPDPNDTQLHGMLWDFYFTNFWKPLRCDEIASQDIANYLFDFAVNSGRGDAVKALQWALNKVTASDLKIDGIIGPKTLESLPQHSIHEYGQSDVVYCEMKIARLNHYIDLVNKHPEQIVFLNGWRRRAMA